MTEESPTASSNQTPSSGGSSRPTPTTHLTRQHPEQNPTGRKLAILSLTALGIVYGDIGTSVLYAIKECFSPHFGVPTSPENVYGVLSLIVWTLTLTVSVKYIIFILRADNRGEGGILALLALIQQQYPPARRKARYGVFVALGIIGAALLYGDGVITPVISVLSAMEGLTVVSPAFQRFVAPLTAVIIFLLFSFQRFGTDRVGKVFGPITLAWFASISIFGVMEIAREPQILKAVNPWYAVKFFAHNGAPGFFILGSVVLTVTGAEALYADMGHFGRKPIRLAWLFVVFPALLLNYFGQGGLLLRDPGAAENPFYRLVPPALLYPMVALATAAACIASQALISGAYSVTQQALQLGYTPRVTITHTSKHEAGQIYIKEVNTALMLTCIALTFYFGSSTKIAATYGIAVTGTMVITTILFFFIARERFGWPLWQATLFATFFLIIDVGFLVANLVKIVRGGWFPIVVAIVVYIMMTTWKKGRDTLRDILREASLPLDLFMDDMERSKPPRVPGTSVFMTSDPQGTPVVLLHHLKHNKMLHQQVILLSVLSAQVPEVDESDRVKVEPLGENFYRVIARYGFMETPDVPEIMECCEAAGIHAKPNQTSYYLGRERLIPRGKSGMMSWRKKLFIFLSRNSRSATEFYGIPPNRVVELGTQIEF
ncbi:MAG: potassium transporter Kup [Gemmatimonadaceae bacterium]|nr:potassium transporter Kup [Gemmatimonadaceae bacterium]MDQ3518521.1 potassium transporter Kup [Gemmatimonadota bacterium]